MKIELDSLEIDGLSVFDRDQKITMPKRQVCSITAENLDDGGSNASGKTSLVNSIPINLFGPKAVGITSEDLKNRYLDGPARVIGNYTIDGAPLSVDRTIGGKLKYKFGSDKWKEGKIDDIQGEINKILKATPEQFLMLSHKAQEESTNFLLMKDSDKKDFLGSFFHLEAYEKAKTSADLEIKIAETSLSTVTGKIAMIQSSIETIKRELFDSEKISESLKSQDNLNKMNILESQYATLTDAINGLSFIVTDANSIRSSHEYKIAQARYDTVMAENNAKTEGFLAQISALHRQRSGIVKEIEASQVVIPQELTKSHDDVCTALQNAAAMLNKKTEISAKIDYVTRELSTKKLKLMDAEKNPTNVCTTCGQKLENHDPRAHLVPLENEINAKEADFAALNSELTQYSKVSDSDIKELNSVKLSILNEMASIRSAANKDNLKAEVRILDGKESAFKREIEMITASSKDAIRQLTNAESEIISGIKGQIALRVSESERIKSDISYIKMQIDTAHATVQKVKAKLASATDELATLELQRAELQNSLKILETTARILSKSGFLGYIFDGILEDLNREINITLKSIPNVRQYSLQFTPDKTTKTTGAVSKNITFVLKDGMGTKNFKPMSGGEKMGIFIAVDESLDAVLSRRLGIQIGWKFLDEQFAWIDSNSKEAILEFYKSRSHNKTYFIIDHASEFNAALDTQIKIIKKDNIARITSGMEL